MKPPQDPHEPPRLAGVAWPGQGQPSFFTPLQVSSLSPSTQASLAAGRMLQAPQVPSSAQVSVPRAQVPSLPSSAHDRVALGTQWQMAPLISLPSSTEPLQSLSAPSQAPVWPSPGGPSQAPG